MERIVVLVTSEEKSKIKKAAGLVPLSAWMKNIALACSGDGYNPSIITSKWKEFQRFLVPVHDKKAKRT